MCACVCKVVCLNFGARESVHVYLCVSVCVSVCVLICMFVCLFVFSFFLLHLYSCLCVSLCMCVHMSVFVIRVFLHVHARAPMFLYVWCVLL